MKKLISVMLVLCMVLALVPAMAFAAAGDDFVRLDGVPYDSLLKAIQDAKPGSVIDVQGDFEGFTLLPGKDITIKLNSDENSLTGQIIVEKGASLTIYGPGVVTNGVAYDAATIYNHGTVKMIGGRCDGVIVNLGTMTIMDEDSYNPATVHGSIINGGEAAGLEHTNAVLNIVSGTYTLYTEGGNDTLITNSEGCKVTITKGTFTSTGGYLFSNDGSASDVVINGGKFNGTNHASHSTDGGFTVNAGYFSDGDVMKHTTQPVATFGADHWIWSGIPYTSGNPYGKGTVAADGTVTYTYAVSQASAQAVLSDSKLPYGTRVDFVAGYMDVTAVSGYHFQESGGTATVNGNTYFNTKAAVPTKHVWQTVTPDEWNNVETNLKAVSKVNVTCNRDVTTISNKQGYYGTIQLVCDVNDLTAYKAGGWTTHGDYAGTHKWYPVIVDFTGLNGIEYSSLATSASAAEYLRTDVGPLTPGVVTVSGNFTWDKLVNPAEYGLTAGRDYYIGWIPVDIIGKGVSDALTIVVDGYRNGQQVLDTYHFEIIVTATDEKPEPTTPPSGTTKPADATTKPAGTGEGDGPAKTGDNSTVMLWATLLVASAAGVAICVVDEAKKRSHK